MLPRARQVLGGPPGLGSEVPGDKGGADGGAKGKSGKDPWDPYGGAKGKDWDPYGGAKGKDWDPCGKGKSGKDWDPYGCGKGGADGYGKGPPGQEWDPYGSGKGGADAGAKGKPGTDLGPYGGGKGGLDGGAKGKPGTDLGPYGGGKGGPDGGCAKGKPDWDPYGYGKGGADGYGKGKDPYGGSKGWGYEDAGWAGKGYDGYGGYDGWGYGYGDYGPWGGGYKGDQGKGAGWGACGKGWQASSSSSGKGGKDDGKSKDITTRYLLSDLPEEASEDEIRAYFGVFSPIEEVTLRKIESNGKIMGSVKFATPTVDLRDQMLKETHEILGKQIQVQTWKMQKMAKPGYAAKKEAESAKYYKGDLGKGAGWGSCGKGWLTPGASGFKGVDPGGKGGKDGKDDGKNKDITARYLLSDLPEVVTEDEIRTYFGVFAPVEEVTLRKIESNGRVVGSVKFATPTVNLRDQMLTETHEILGKQIQVQTWKMQKMAKPNYAAKKEAESAKYFAQKQEAKAKGKGIVPGLYKAY